MWFEILPGAVIITVALTVPIYAMYGINKLTLGHVRERVEWGELHGKSIVNLYNRELAYRRNMDARFNRVMYLRDTRLTKNPYIQNGLDSIPDEKE